MSPKNQTDNHPQPEQLQAFVHGRLNDPELAVVEGHLQECERCCETLVGFRDDTFVSRVRRVRDHAAIVEQSETSPDQTERPSAASDATILESPDATADDASVPEELASHPRYELRQEIGRGGMGRVYRARHRLMNRDVAIKVINSRLVQSSLAVERFRREVQAAAHLGHPNIVAAFDAEQAGDVHFLVMEYVDGRDLASIVAEEGPLPVDTACDYIRQAARGLQHAYEAGMVHRDIKPHNLMLAPDGTVRILDFGLAGCATECLAECDSDPAIDSDLRQEAPSGDSSDRLTAVGSIMGTPDYVAPEQARDARLADIRADLYSLGCTFYFLLTGEPPFQRKTVPDTLKAHAEADRPDVRSQRPEVPASVSSLILRLLAVDPQQRPSSPLEVIDALTDAGQTRRPPQRPRWWMAAAALPVLIIAGLIIYIATDNGKIRIDATGAQASGAKIVLLRGGEPYATFDVDATDQPQSIRAGTYEVQIINASEDVELDVQFRRSETHRWIENSGSATDPAVMFRGGEMMVRILERPAVKVSATEPLEGVWLVQSGVRSGQPMPVEQIPIQQIQFSNSRITVHLPESLSGDEDRWQTGIYRVSDEGSQSVLHIQPQDDHRELDALYRIEGQQLTLCMNHAGIGATPTEFSSPPGSSIDLIFLKRIANAAPAPTKLTQIGQFQGHAGGVNDAVFLPGGATAASAGEDGTIRIWTVETQKQIELLEDGDAPVLSLAVSKDGLTLASGSRDHSIRLWNLQTGEVTATLTGHAGLVSNIAFMPDGTHIISSSFDETLRIWNLETQELVRTVNLEARVEKMVPLWDGRRIMLNGAHTGAWGVKTFDLENAQPVDTSISHQSCLAVSADGRMTLVGNITGLIRVTDMESGQLVVQMADPKANAAFDAAILPGGRHAITTTRDYLMYLWDLSAGRMIETVKDATVGRVTLSADGQFALTIRDEGRVGVWQIGEE